MKTLKFIIVVVLSIVLGANAIAQTSDHKTAQTKTDTIKVWGACEMCKARIEKTAKIEGVSKAEWNIKTHLLTLVYDPSKVTNDNIQKKLAAVGHDTPKYKADDKIYNSLPPCCKYERRK